MKKFAVAAIILLSTFLSTALLQAEKPTALFLLDVEPNIRLYSTGRIFTSVTPADAFYNPWSLGWTVNSGITFSRWPGTVEDSQFNFGGFISPATRLGKFNFSCLNYSTGEETIEELDGTTKKVKLEQNMIISIGYGKEVGSYLQQGLKLLRLGNAKIKQRIFFGGNIKYLSSSLAEEYKDRTLLYDLGILFHSLNDTHNIGISVRNSGGKLQYGTAKESLPSELKLGYSYKFKFRPNHKLLLGTALSQAITGDMRTLSIGCEYFPGLPFISLLGGITSREDLTYFTAGLGFTYRAMELNLGCAYSMGSSFEKTTPLRFSLNWLFGPTDEYSIAEEYLNLGMRDKALALWEKILPGEKQYAKAQYAIRKYMYPGELVVSASLEDEDGDGILAGEEKGNLLISISNQGKGKAEGLKISISKEDIYKDIKLGAVSASIEKILPGEKKVVKLPVSATKEIYKADIPIQISVTEIKGFSPPPYTYHIATKPYPPPVLALARYTFREDNTGHSIGNGNGMIEKGEQIELTGYVVNVGESTAKDVIARLVSENPRVKVLSGFEEIKLGNLAPNEWGKILSVFKIEPEYRGAEKLPLTLNLVEQRARYSKTQELDLTLRRFYQDPIEPMFADFALFSSVMQKLPTLAGPIPGTRARELITAKAGEPPILEYELKIIPDENRDNIYQPGETLALRVGIRNTGTGPAKGVKILLSGDKTIASLIGKIQEVGDIEPGRYQLVLLQSKIPKAVPRKEAIFKIEVSEERGFSPKEIKEIRVALMPEEVKVVRVLPKLLPWPDAYKDQRPNAGAVVIGISNYRNVNKLKYARKDAELFSKYLNGFFGIPDRKIKKFFDDRATKSTIETGVKDWLAKKDFEFVVLYFAGHGVPDPENPRTGEPFISLTMATWNLVKAHSFL